MIAQRVGDLIVEEGQQLVAAVDERDLHPEALEHRRILAADHPGPNHRQPPWPLGEGEGIDPGDLALKLEALRRIEAVQGNRNPLIDR